MSGSASALEAQLQAARRRECEVEPGVRITYELPGAYRVQRIIDAMRAGDGEAVADLLAPQVTAWAGITEASLLGAGVGGSGVPPVSQRIVTYVLADRPGWVTALAMHAVEQASERTKAIGQTQGN